MGRSASPCGAGLVKKAVHPTVGPTAVSAHVTILAARISAPALIETPTHLMGSVSAV